MTKEELVKEAKDSWWNDNNCSGALPTEKIYECGYLASAEPREKQIQIDAEQIRALQKDKGELTDRVKELETSVSNLRKDNKELREVLPKLDKENDELKYKLTKAKEIIKQLMRAIPYGSGKLATEAYDKAEQFLNSEVEKYGIYYDKRNSTM